MKKLNKMAVFTTLATGMLFTFSFFFFSKDQLKVENYCYYRDKELVLDSFKTDWYWLIPDGQNFDPLTVFPEHGSKDKIKTLIESGKPVGYLAYHKEDNLDWAWRLRFLNIKPNKRNKGYAEKLINSAIDDIKKSGGKVIILMTRTNNPAARKLYKKLGFTEKPKSKNPNEKYTDFILKF
jgi:ribosomal protein S18 acetylase RimI-like enzyme